MKRAHVFIHGDVINVGFRSWARRQAQKLKLTGWVKNTVDKTVEAVFEGHEDNVKDMVDKCYDGPEVSWVEKVDVIWEEETGEFEGFEVEN